MEIKDTKQFEEKKEITPEIEDMFNFSEEGGDNDNELTPEVEDMFNFGDDGGEQETSDKEVSNEQETSNKETSKEENTGSNEGEEEVDIPEELLDEILKEADLINDEQVQEAADDLQEAIDTGAPEAEVVQKIQELENALNDLTLENETLSKEKERLINKINELQDKLAEYDMRGYEYGPIEKVMDENPDVKGFVKLLAFYKANPEKIGKDKLIDALDNLTTKEFGVSIKGILEEKAKKENKVMTQGEDKTPIEINVESNKDPFDEMFDF